MKLDQFTHLTYCMNVHKGERWDAQLTAIQEVAGKVKRKISYERPFGLGLRIARKALDELEEGDTVQRFGELLKEAGCYVFTVNAFPYGSFHDTVVKTKVYEPDWSEKKRLDYTLGVCRVLAQLLPEGVEGSISTVPLAYRWPGFGAAQTRQACHNLADVAAKMHSIGREENRLLHLGLEPEPDCILETTDEFIAFYENDLVPAAVERLRDKHGFKHEDALGIIYRHIGICFDTCHAAMVFEDFEEAIGKLVRHGIRISKIQLSSALEIRMSQEAHAALRPFAADEVYLHQVKALDQAGRLTRWDDLRPFLAEQNQVAAGSTCRIHYHVPLGFTGDGELQSTGRLLTPEFYSIACGAGVSHFEIETYTFDVLPPEMRQNGLVASILSEYERVLSDWNSNKTANVH